MNIHRLNAKGKDCQDQRSIEQLIEKIITTYNDKNKEVFPQNIYHSKDIIRWNANEHRGFHAKIFYSKRPALSGFAQWVCQASSAEARDFKTYTCHFICFLYRQIRQEKNAQKSSDLWEAFALTTNDGWRVVKQFADFKSPLKITARLIDPNLSSIESKSLAGHKDSSVETFRQEYALRQHETDTLWHLFKDFHSYFKEGSSLYHPRYGLTAFIDPQHPKRFNKRSVEIGIGKILVGGQLTMQQHEEILEHFANIALGEKTVCLQEDVDVEEKEDPVWRYLENIQPVEMELVPRLNHALMQLVWQYYQNNKLDGQLSFVHRWYKDFYYSSEFTLKYKDGHKITFQYHPSLSQIFQALRQWYGPCTTLEDFISKIENTKLKFHRKPEFFDLQEFFQGELPFEQERYFRVDGLWLQVKAGHLTVLQRSFHKLLNAHLMAPSEIGQLKKTWYAKKEWTAFSLEDLAIKELNKGELEQSIKDLQETQFSFIDEEGFVHCPYPTHCILESSSGSFNKLLQKKWEDVRLFLSQKKEQNQPVTKEELGQLLVKPPKKTRSNLKKPPKKAVGNPGEMLWNLLTEKRPVISLNRIGMIQKIAVLRPDGVPAITNLSLLTLSSKKTIESNKSSLESYLSQQSQNGSPCTQEGIRKSLGFSSKRYAENVFQAFKEVKNAPALPLVNQSYLVQGPIPNDFKASESILQFLRQQHENYRLVLAEEGYNRLYLTEDHFLVCDQVYAGKKEQVELFDLLQYDSSFERVYLYHVKESFGQKTREACAQVRVAAIILRNAIDSGSYEILRKIYTEVTGTSSLSPFRQMLKKVFESLPLPNASEVQSDRLVNLFPQNRSNICFVYAFIDSSEKKERLLSDEKDPSYEFGPNDFKQFKDDIYHALKNRGILDEHGRLKNSFMSSTKEKFCLKMKDLEKPELIYDILHRHTSQFDSLIAKVELMQLRDFIVDQLGFDFKICQINRSVGSNLPSETSSFEFEQSLDQFTPPSAKKITYLGKTYLCETRPCNASDVLTCILGSEPLKEGKRSTQVKLAVLFKKHQFTNSDLWLSYFKKGPSEKFKGYSSIYHSLLAVQGKDLSADDYDLRFNDYLQCLLSPNFSLAEEEWHLAASCLDIRLEIVSESKTGEFNQNQVINPRGHKKLLFVQNGKQFLRLREPDFIDDASEAMDTCEELTQCSEIFSPEKQTALLSQEQCSGMNNRGPDCFFNSAFQLLVHSPFWELLLDEDNVTEKGQAFYSFFKELSLNYCLASEEDCKNDQRLSTQYPGSKMRELLAFTPDQHEDCEEAIRRIFAFYDIDHLKSLFNKHQIIDIKKAASIAGDPSQYSELKGRSISTTISEIMLPLSVPKKGSKEVQELIDDLFIDTIQLEKIKFVKNNQVYQATGYTETFTVNALGNHLFFHLKRFYYEGNTRHKISTPISMSSFECKIDDISYELQGFVLHYGESAYGGHYKAFCKTSNGWTRFDDTRVKLISQKEALEEAKDAYILYYSKIEEADQSLVNSTDEVESMETS
jgi:hypothetical protein